MAHHHNLIPATHVWIDTARLVYHWRRTATAPVCAADATGPLMPVLMAVEAGYSECPDCDAVMRALESWQG